MDLKFRDYTRKSVRQFFAIAALIFLRWRHQINYQYIVKSDLSIFINVVEFAPLLIFILLDHSKSDCGKAFCESRGIDFKTFEKRDKTKGIVIAELIIAPALFWLKTATAPALLLQGARILAGAAAWAKILKDMKSRFAPG